MKYFGIFLDVRICVSGVAFFFPRSCFLVCFSSERDTKCYFENSAPSGLIA